MNKIMTFYKKLKDLIGHGRTGALIRGFLFINLSFFLGMWLGIKFFLPDDFLLSKINERLFVKDMGLIAEDVDVSLLGNISIYEGTLTEKGEKAITFYELSFSPSFFDLMFGEISGTVFLDDINNQGGQIEVSFETGENPCYYVELDTAPLSVLKPFVKDISLVGDISGELELCQSEKKTYDGYVNMVGKDIVFRGKFPTPMGPLNVGKIDFGNLDLSCDIKNSMLTIGKFIAEGLFGIDIAGKVTLNPKSFDASGINLDVRIKAPDQKKIEQNPTLNLAIGQLSKFKKGKDEYAFLLKGRVMKPRMLNAPDKRVMKTDSVEKEKDDKKDKKKKVKRKSRKRPRKRTPRKTVMPKPDKREKPFRNNKDSTRPERKKSLKEDRSATKREDDVEEKKPEEEKEVEQKEEQKEEEVKNTDTTSEEDEEEKEVEGNDEKKQELPDNSDKESGKSEEDEKDEEE